MIKADTPPVRDDLSDLTPYGAPQIDVPVRLNTNENPYPPSPSLVRAVADAVAEAAATLNRYPDRDAVELRKALADYLGHDLTGAQLWAANGSNEVIQQLLQAFGGPGRRALGFDPGYSMHSLIARVTCTGWVSAARDEDFGLDPERAARVIGEHQPDLTFLTSPNNLAPAWWWSTRRTPSSPARARRARSPCCRATRTWWSPAPCPRRSPWPGPGSATWPPRPR